MVFVHLPFQWNKILRGISIDSPPIFIVGCGHSGTSLIRTILGTHSRIYAIPQESNIAIEENYHWFQRSLQEFDQKTIAVGKHRWVEKTPKHIYHIGKILEWCPDAKILLIIRDGRDVGHSIQARSGNLVAGLKRWVADNLAGKAYWNHSNVYVFKYEDLISDFDTCIHQILDFLSEKYENTMKEFYRQPRIRYLGRNGDKEISPPPNPSGNNHVQYRNWQLSQPLFDGRGRWQGMSDEEKVLMNKIAGEMLNELGYV